MFTQEGVAWLLEALGGIDEPLGLYFTPERPEGGISPREGAHGGCLLNFLRLARERNEPAWFAGDRTGCRGANAYLGFSKPLPYIPEFVSTGSPTMEGERYMPNPEAVRRYLDDLDVPPAPAPYCVVKPLGLFRAGEEPRTVFFLETGEALSGLCQLAVFALGDHHALAAPFGAGCSGVSAWPEYYARRGEEKAILGGFDPSCRPFVGMDQLLFTVSAGMFGKMVAAAPDSFLTGKDWRKVVKKMGRRSR